MPVDLDSDQIIDRFNVGPRYANQLVHSDGAMTYHVWNGFVYRGGETFLRRSRIRRFYIDGTSRDAAPRIVIEYETRKKVLVFDDRGEAVHTHGIESVSLGSTNDLNDALLWVSHANEWLGKGIAWHRANEKVA